jgi:serine O-acetyltransferase
MGLINDAKQIARRDPAARGVFSVILLYPGFHALVFYRLAHTFQRIRLLCLARWISQVGRFFTGIEIHPAAKIGKGLFIDHGMGVVIGETAAIGDHCTLYHGCTLGGTGKEKGKRHPTLGDHVLVGAGAKILGPFYVGNNAMIGANAVVLSEVPEGATVVGVPGHVIRKKDEEHSFRSVELDQTNTPDPISVELCKALHRIKRIETALSMNDQFSFEQPTEYIVSEAEIKKICKESNDPSLTDKKHG